MADEPFEIKIPEDAGEAIVYAFELLRELLNQLGPLIPEVLQVLEQYGQLFANIDGNVQQIATRLEDVYNEQKAQTILLEQIADNTAPPA